MSLSRKEMKKSVKCIMFDFQGLAHETLLGSAGKLWTYRQTKIKNAFLMLLASSAARSSKPSVMVESTQALSWE